MGMFKAPSVPAPPPAPPPAPDLGDEAIQRARTMERRRQLGLLGRMSTFLTTAEKPGGGGATAPPAGKTLLGS